MKRVSLMLLASILAAICSCPAAETPDVNNKTGLPVSCEAAAPKLRDAKSDTFVLSLEVDDQGKVHSFKTKSPEGVRLEEIGAAADEIKALRFVPAKKDG